MLWTNPKYELPPIFETIPAEDDMPEMSYSKDVLLWFREEPDGDPVFAKGYINYTMNFWYSDELPLMQKDDPRILAWAYCPPPPDFRRPGKFFNL